MCESSNVKNVAKLYIYVGERGMMLYQIHVLNQLLLIKNETNDPAIDFYTNANTMKDF